MNYETRIHHLCRGGGESWISIYHRSRHEAEAEARRHEKMPHCPLRCTVNVVRLHA